MTGLEILLLNAAIAATIVYVAAVRATRRRSRQISAYRDRLRARMMRTGEDLCWAFLRERDATLAQDLHVAKLDGTTVRHLTLTSMDGAA